MAKCSKCGHENDDSSSFCLECGNSLDKQEDNHVVFEELITAQKPNKRKKIIKIASIIALIACIVGFGGFWTYGYMLKKNPVKWVSKSVAKYSEADTIYSTSKLKVHMNIENNNVGNAKLVAKLIETMSIQSKTKVNKKTNESLYDVSLNLGDETILNGKIYANDKQAIVSIPALCSENIYVNIDEINELVSKETGKEVKGNIDYKKYKDLLDFSKTKDFKEVKKDYSEFMYENVNPLFKKGKDAELNIETDNGKKDTVKCSTLEFNIDLDKSTELLKKILLKVADDSKVKNILNEKMNEFFTIVEKNNDYDKVNLTKADIAKAKEEFSKEYDKAMKELKNNLGQLDNLTKGNSMNKNGVNVNLDSYLYIDSKNRLRGFNHEISAKIPGAGSVKLTSETVVNSINERITIDKPDTKNAINAAKATQSDIERVGREVEENLRKLMSDKFGF